MRDINPNDPVWVPEGPEYPGYPENPEYEIDEPDFQSEKVMEAMREIEKLNLDFYEDFEI